MTLHVPLSDSAILGSGHEDVLLLRVPLAIVDRCDMAFCVCHVQDIHISSDRRAASDALVTIYFGLVISTAAKEVLPARTV